MALADHQDKSLRQDSVSVLRDLVQENPLLCAWSGAFRVLIDAIIDPLHAELSERIVYTLVVFLNEASTRDQVWQQLDFSRIFWIFTDVDLKMNENNTVVV